LQARGFSIGAMGVLAATIGILGALGAGLGGWITDRYFSRKLRIPIIASRIVAALFLYLVAFAPTKEAAATYLILLTLLSSLGSAAIFTVPIVTVPKHAVGGAFGIVNTAGQLAGVISPVFVGYLLEITHGNFVIVLCGMLGIILLSILPASLIRQQSAAQLPA
jgi:nitrate/nitrite transporter NarK